MESYTNYDQLPLMLSVAQLADFFGLSHTGAYRLTRCEDFPVVKLGRAIRIPKEDLIAWLKERTVSQNPSFSLDLFR